ncbi:ribosome biogenesis GTPase Der [Patescibacteria group bacterium]|nr:ribosome biogenesis GTPase Der [Patescibacteria group bacterium]MBU1705515.1 ribosome biogenesis GTPase Der [Patescibacteria group bacterium]
MTNSLPTIALVGRTNVGKSTLFNRLLESHKALVSDIPGTTRDRKEGYCFWRGTAIRVIDTGGLDIVKGDVIEENIAKQAKLAIKQADVILFVVDVKSDPLPQDHEFARELKKSKKPVLVVGNKAETPAARALVAAREWNLAGLPTPIAVSALRGSGVGDLLDAIYQNLEKLGKPPAPMSTVKPVQVAVIGKPNVGKSTLLNTLLGEERFIATPQAFTTREPNDVLLEVDGRSYMFIDTAGIRKAGKVRKTGGLEKAGVDRTKKVIKDADVALFVMDINEPLGTQEKVLAGMIKDENLGIIAVANKWDLIDNKTPKTLKTYEKYIAGSIPFIAWAPVIFISALTHQRVDKLFDLIDQVQANRFAHISERALEDFWRQAVVKHKPSRGKGPKPPSVLGMKQIGTAPPTFQLVIKAKREDVLHPSYLRFLENRLREQFDLVGTPIRIHVKTATAVGKRK